jgi:hypothetical protein
MSTFYHLSKHFPVGSFIKNKKKISFFDRYKYDDMFNELHSVIDALPAQILSLQYSMRGRTIATKTALKEDFTISVNLGFHMKVDLVLNEPVVKWGYEPESYYTLVMVDPDATLHDDIKSHCVLHWLVVNIPGDRIFEGEDIVQYTAPNPRMGANPHRFIFLLFKQICFNDFSKFMKHQSSDLRQRGVFNLRLFENTFELILVAVNFFYGERSVPSCIKSDNSDNFRKNVLRKRFIEVNQRNIANE